MIAARPLRNRILLVIAPTLYECRKTLDQFEIPIERIGEIRSVTKALQLRGWTPGTPFITASRDSWFATQQGVELSIALDALMLDGRLRTASKAELEEFQQLEFCNVR